jgi:hypothetical protein
MVFDRDCMDYNRAGHVLGALLTRFPSEIQLYPSKKGLERGLFTPRSMPCRVMGPLGRQ